MANLELFASPRAHLSYTHTYSYLHRRVISYSSSHTKDTGACRTVRILQALEKRYQPIVCLVVHIIDHPYHNPARQQVQTCWSGCSSSRRRAASRAFSSAVSPAEPCCTTRRGNGRTRMRAVRKRARPPWYLPCWGVVSTHPPRKKRISRSRALWFKNDYQLYCYSMAWVLVQYCCEGGRVSKPVTAEGGSLGVCVWKKKSLRRLSTRISPHAPATAPGS